MTTLELAKSINHIIRLNELNTNLIQLTNGQKISKYSLIEIINDVFSLKLNLIASSEYKVDKSLKNSSNFIYQVPDYRTMIEEMYDWILKHSELYKHYNLI